MSEELAVTQMLYLHDMLSRERSIGEIIPLSSLDFSEMTVPQYKKALALLYNHKDDELIQFLGSFIVNQKK